MNSITLFIRDLKLASNLSDHMTVLDRNVNILENIDDLSPSAKLILVDLDENDFGSVEFISSLFTSTDDLKIIGFMRIMHKDTVDKLKSAGCKMIITKSSILKNITSLIKEFGN